MRAVVSHPTGNPNVRAVLRGLGHNGALEAYWTSVALPPLFASMNWLPIGVRRMLSQRTFPEVSWDQIHMRPAREAARLFARRFGVRQWDRHETGWASTDAVYRGLDGAVAKYIRSAPEAISAIYAYEDGAHETFLAAGEIGCTRFYDLPIAHWRTLRRLLLEEGERRPEWAPTMAGLRDSQTKLDRKDAEIELADQVIVASSFTRRSLEKEFADLSVHVTPYGCPPLSSCEPSRRSQGAALELFFAGHLTQRKGIADLIDALAMLEVDWRLTLAGPCPALRPSALKNLLADSRCTWLGEIPHAALLEAMTKAHVLIFPSIVEGFGMVITEALSSGLPVITTPHTAGPDILEEGVDGFIVPIRSPAAITEAVTKLYDDEDLRGSMSMAARKKAADHSWDGYEKTIAHIVAAGCTEVRQR